MSGADPASAPEAPSPGQAVDSPGPLFSLPDRTVLALVLGLTAACLLPFLNKAFYIDDTLFLAAARRILTAPLDPYGFAINWDGTVAPMAAITKNPPLAAYYIALVARCFGWSEPVLHAAFLLPALAVAAATFLLARRLCREPLLAAAAAVATPVFLVSATSVMCDVLMLAFFVWAVLLWIDGIERDAPHRLAAASLLAAAAFLSKYFGLSLVPLLAAYAIARRARVARWVPHLLVPLAAVAAYFLWTWALYGRVLILEAVSYSAERKAAAGSPLWINALVALVFTGGCLLPAGVLAILALRKTVVAVAAGMGAAAGLYAWRVTAVPGRTVIDVRDAAAVGAHLGLFAFLGLLVLTLAVVEARRFRDPASLLLASWTIGTFVFTGFLNWTINGRSLLPMAPAAAMLAARGIEARGWKPSRAKRLLLGGLLGALALIALGVCLGDYRLANAARDMAGRVESTMRTEPGRVLFLGHWGFQHYMERAGAEPVDMANPQLRPGDRIVVPKNSSRFSIPEYLIAERREVALPIPGWFATVAIDRGACFYAHLLGPLPFRAGPVPDETYRIVRLAP